MKTSNTKSFDPGANPDTDNYLPVPVSINNNSNNNNNTMTESVLKPEAKSKAKAFNPGANQDDDIYLPVPVLSTASVIFPASPSSGYNTDSDNDDDNDNGNSDNAGGASDGSSTNENESHDHNLPWFAILLFLTVGILIIVAINSVHPMVSVMVLHCIFTLTFIGFVISIVYNCCCCKKPKRSTQGSSRIANKRDYKGCGRDIGVSVLLFFVLFSIGLVVLFAMRSENWISNNEEWSLIAICGGVAMIIMAILFLSWMAKRNRFNASSNHGTNDTIHFWRGYWVSVCIIISCYYFGLVFIMASNKIIAPNNIFPCPQNDSFWGEPDICFLILEGLLTQAYLWNSFMIMIVFVMRIMRWRKNNANANASNTSIGNGIYSVDLFIYLIGVPSSYLLNAGINYVGLNISLLVFVASTFLAVVVWCIITWCGNGNERDTTTATDDNPSSSTRNEKYPKDSYSFLALYGPRHDINLFSFGLIPFLVQSILLIVMILSIVISDLKTTEVDNPAEDTGSFWAGVMPANASPIVRVTQITSLFAYTIFQDSSLSDVTTAIELFPKLRRPGIDGEESRGLALSCTLRFLQGMLSIFAVFLLVMTSSEVLEIILNFTAVNFISKMDDLAFDLAKLGKYGTRMMKAANEIENKDLPKCCYRTSKHKRYLHGVFVISLLLLVMIGYVVVSQVRNDLWVTKTVRVQFEDSTTFQSFSGCYAMNKDKRPNGRYIYDGFELNKSRATLGYCKKERRWLFFTGDYTDPCKAYGSEEEVAHSPRTDTFDIKKAIEENWFSQYNTPFEMYFIEDDDLIINCGSFLNDGKCDKVFNNFNYQYDSGDCCPATCTDSSCTSDELSTGFDIGLSSGDGSGYPFTECKDPSMVSITILLDEIKLSDQALNALLLKLDCGTRNMFTITAKESMEGGTEDAIIEDGSTCSFYVTEDSYDGVTDLFPVLKYRVFHGSKNVNIISNDQFLILEGQSRNSANNENFQVNGIFSSTNTIKGNIGLLTSSTSIRIAGYNLTGAIPIEIGFLTELTTLDLSNNNLTSIPSDIGLLTDLTTLDLSNNTFTSTIPSEIGLLTEMTELDLDNNDLTGTIPSEIGLLTEIKELYLRGNDLYGSIPSEIGLLTELTELYLAGNHLTGTIPSEIRLLTEMTELDLGSNALTGTFPSWIGLLTEMTKLNLGENRLISTIPSEIGLLTEMTELYLGRNDLYRNIMSKFDEFGNYFLEPYRYHNALYGTIPNEIGLLTELAELYLDDNAGLTGTIPSEVGLLIELGLVIHISGTNVHDSTG